MENIVKQEIAFDYKHDEHFRFVATYLEIPRGDALIEIFKDAKLIKEFLFPGYKIYNIPAHAHDIVEDLERGLTIAGSTGLGGNVYQGGN